MIVRSWPDNRRLPTVPDALRGGEAMARLQSQAALLRTAPFHLAEQASRASIGQRFARLGDLIVQAPSIFRFRGEVRYGMATREVTTATTDFGVTVARLTGAVGTRYDVEQRTNFLQGSVRAELKARIPNVVQEAAANFSVLERVTGAQGRMHADVL